MKKRSQGFSLIELLTVVAIIGILAAIAIPQYTDYVRKAREAEAKGALLQIQNLQEQFYQDYQVFAIDYGAVKVAPAAPALNNGEIKWIEPAKSKFSYAITPAAGNRPQNYVVHADGIVNSMMEEYHYAYNSEGVKCFRRGAASALSDTDTACPGGEFPW